MRKIKRRKKTQLSELELSNVLYDALGMTYWSTELHAKRNNLLLTLDKHIDNKNFDISITRINPSLAFYFKYLFTKWKYYLENPPKHYNGPEDKYQGWFYLVPKKVDLWFQNTKGLNNYEARRPYTKQLVESNLLQVYKIKRTPTINYYKINIQELWRRYQIQFERVKYSDLQLVYLHELDCGLDHDLHYIKDISNNIYSSFNKLKEDEKTSFSKDPYLEGIKGTISSSSTAKSPLRKKLTSRPRDIKRRSNNPPIDKVISHWSNLGYPLAKVNKPEVLYPLIHKAKTKLGYKEVIKVIDRGFGYFQNPDFKFANNSKKISMKSFFTKPTFAKDPATIFFQKNKVRNWCTIFRNKSDEWLEDNCLTTPKITSIKNFKFLSNLLSNRHKQHKKNDIIRASNKMSKFFSTNGFEFQGTIETDMTNFFHQHYPDMDKFKVYWMKSDNFWNRQVAQYLVNYGRFTRINEVKKI